MHLITGGCNVDSQNYVSGNSTCSVEAHVGSFHVIFALNVISWDMLQGV